MHRLTRIIDAGLDAKTANPGLLRRVRIVNIGILAMLGMGIPTIAQYASLGVPHMCLAVAATMAAAAGTMLLLRRTLQPRRCGGIVTALFYVLLLISNSSSGGFYDPNFAWLYTLPVAAAIFVDLRAAWIWVGIICATTLGFWGLDEFGVGVPNLIPPDAVARQSLFNRLSAILGLGVLSSTFVVGQRRAERRLEEAIQRLRRESGYVQLLQQAATLANEATSLDEAFRGCVSLVCRSTGWPVGHAYLPAADGSGELAPSSIWHLEQPERYATLREVTEQTRFAPGVGLPGRVLVSRRPAWIVDVTRDSNFPRARIARDLGVGTGAAFPVVVEGVVVAVLEFFSDRKLPPDPQMLELFAHVGEQLGHVSARRQLERRLLQSRKIEAVGRLAAGIAHEINNPMAYVRTNLSLLRNDWQALHEDLVKVGVDEPILGRVAEFEELIDDALEGVERTVALVREIREFAHTGDVRLQAANLEVVVEDALRDAAGSLQSGVRVEREFDPLPPLRCSPSQLRQLFLNLLVNAGHAVGESGRIRVRIARGGGGVVVRVEDDGCGIAPEVVERIFEPFFTTKPAGQGTGLGLYICYEIVRLHGGEIRVQSRPGSGTRFDVWFPAESLVEEASPS